MNKVILTATVGLGLCVFSAAANATNIKEGKWSMTITIHADGMDEQAAEAAREMEKMSPEEKAMMQKMMGGMGMNMGGPGGGMGITHTQCITNDNPVPEASEDEDCEQTHTMQGNTVNFEVTCPKSHSTGQVTYRNKSMNGTIQSTQIEGKKTTNSTIDISGEYVGPCDDEGASAEDLSERGLSLKQKELDLKRQELEIKQKELELEAGTTAKAKKGKPSLDDVNSAVNTTNNVKNTFSGLRSLLGR